MTPVDALEQHRAFINELGEDVIVRRYAGTGTNRPKTDVTTRARVAGYAASEIIGSIVQGDRHVIALVDTLSDVLPVLTTDKLVIRGKECAIKSVDDNTRRIAGVLIALELQVAG